MRLRDLVSGWMTDRPVTLPPDAPVLEAYALMGRHGVHHIPVVEGGRLVGMLSDRDLHRAAPLRRPERPGDVAPLYETPVSDLMTREGFITADPMTTLGEAALRLVEARVNALPVLDGDRLVGIITTLDLLAALADERARPPARTQEATVAEQETKRSFIHRLERELERFDLELGKIRRAVATTGGELREDARAALEAIGRRIEEARRKLEELELVGEDAFGEARLALEALWTDVRAGVERVRQARRAPAKGAGRERVE